MVRTGSDFRKRLSFAKTFPYIFSFIQSYWQPSQRITTVYNWKSVYVRLFSCFFLIAMVELDGDDIRISSRGKMAERDIVQVSFVLCAFCFFYCHKRVAIILMLFNFAQVEKVPLSVYVFTIFEFGNTTKVICCRVRTSWVNLGPGCDLRLSWRRVSSDSVFLLHDSLSHSGTTWIARETTCWAWRDWLRTSWQRSPTSWSLTWRAEALNQTWSHQPTPLAPNLRPTRSEHHRWGRGRFRMGSNPLKALSWKWIPLSVRMLRLPAVLGEAADLQAPLREDECAERPEREI